MHDARRQSKNRAGAFGEGAGRVDKREVFAVGELGVPLPGANELAHVPDDVGRPAPAHPELEQPGLRAVCVGAGGEQGDLEVCRIAEILARRAQGTPGRRGVDALGGDGGEESGELWARRPLGCP